MRPTSVLPVKVSLRIERVLAEFLADIRGPRRGHHRQQPLGHPGAFGQHRHRQRRQRRLGGGTRDKAAARRQRRGDLAGDHRVRKIPRRDRGANPDRLFQHGDPLVAQMAGDGLAIDALGLLAEPFHKRGAIEDFALCLGQRLAHFGGQDGAQIVGIGDHQVIPFAQHRRAFLAGARRPVLHRHIRGGDGARHLGPGQIGHLRDHVATRRVGHGKGLAVVGVDPFPRHIGAGFQQRRVFQQAAQVGRLVQHDILILSCRCSGFG